MSFIRRYIGDLFICRRWYLLAGGCALLLFLAYFIPALYRPMTVVVALLLVFMVIDYVLLFLAKGNITATRSMPYRFSIGEDNMVVVELTNTCPFKVNCVLIDELPFQFQDRDFHREVVIGYKAQARLEYTLRPLSRGTYAFGSLLCYATSPIGLLRRRITVAPPADVKVYPAFQQLKKYRLLAVGGTTLTGARRIRRLGHSLEFEKIKDYVQGDDVRTINWKATARSGRMMVNTFTDARQQQIYCLVDKGRSMKMPFDGMTLLDHAINAVLSLLNVALLRQDKAGLITFSNKVNDIVIADRRNSQMQRIIEVLYHQQTEYKESDHNAVWSMVQRSITQRSLLLLFTNFETYSSMERQLPFLKKLAQRHLVCVVFFQNTLLKEIHASHPDNIEGIYIKTIASQFDLEKRLIVKELRKYGILSILTTPGELTVDVINKYLELKARQMV